MSQMVIYLKKKKKKKTRMAKSHKQLLTKCSWTLPFPESQIPKFNLVNQAHNSD